MNGSEIKKHLYSLVNKGIKYDLDRMIAAANSINNPQTFYKSFHVAGTNGKGSTCSFIESVLRASGFKTGLYTSPHILRFEERFRVNGEIVTEDKWLSVYKDIHDKLDIYNLTFFEASTLIAFELFKRENVDWAVFETGLGGRLDATNIIMPQVSVITRIAMDHMDLLGNTLADIAKEKFGIIKKDTSVVCAENSDPPIM
ncbi:MAG: bifunctional folylpolyglutamate synthase/dihydrofolate synthase, partial [Fibrobacter sp.]|nr:bifunctional folylpolyglutamate synthase/dihydrofolate synthase [Fibrobacter sp.]